MDHDWLTELEIRRALAELMTAENVDEAMGWPAGMARRRRWERDGLPPADAELGGVPLWFRSTIERWRAEVAEPALEISDDVDEGEGDAATEGDPVDQAAAVVALQLGEPDPAPGDEPDEEDGLDDERAGDVADEPDDDATVPAPPADELPGTPIASGFDVELGQPVFARVKGEWRPAVVDARTHETVIVQYSVGEGPLDQRVMRLGVDAVRNL